MSGSNKSLILTDEDIRRSGYHVDPFDADGRYVGAPLVRVDFAFNTPTSNVNGSATAGSNKGDGEHSDLKDANEAEENK